MADKRILIVDDDPDLVSVLKTAIEPAGYDVVTAKNGTEGWEKAKETSPDLAIVDVMMDTFGEGIKLTHRFRQDQDLKGMPIIMLTAVNQNMDYSIDAETDEGYLPVDKFMEKPVEPSELLSEIAKLLQ